MIKKLIKLANQLDQKGLYKEADFIDSLVKQAISQSGLIKALKGGNPGEIRKAFAEFVAALPSYTTPEKELRMTHSDFNDFVVAIQKGDVARAKELMGIGDIPLYKSKPKTALMGELKNIKTMVAAHGGISTRGIFYTNILKDGQDYIISIDAGLTFKSNELIDKLKKIGFKQFIPSGNYTSLSKTINGDRIVIDVDAGSTVLSTYISISPATKENYDVVAGVFGAMTSMGPSNIIKNLTFEEAKQEIDAFNPPIP